jgi:hypothetical protein
MRIHTRDVILHERIRLEADQTYDVPDELGAYVVAQGWAYDEAGESGERQVGPIDVDPASVRHVTTGRS